MIPVFGSTVKIQDSQATCSQLLFEPSLINPYMQI